MRQAAEEMGRKSYLNRLANPRRPIPSKRSKEADPLEVGITNNSNHLYPVRLPCTALIVLFVVLHRFPVVLCDGPIISNLVSNSHPILLVMYIPCHGYGLLNKWFPGESAIHDHISTFIQCSHEEREEYQFSGLEHVIMMTPGADSSINDIRLFECISFNHHRVCCSGRPEGSDMRYFLEHSALASSHPTTHQKKNRAPIGNGCRNHHLSAVGFIMGSNADGLHLLHQCRYDSCDLQVLYVLAEPLTTRRLSQLGLRGGRELREMGSGVIPVESKITENAFVQLLDKLHIQRFVVRTLVYVLDPHLPSCNCTISACHPLEEMRQNKMQNVEEGQAKSYQHSGGSFPAAPPARTRPAQAPAVDPSSAAASSVAGRAVLRRWYRQSEWQ
ncbi:hypothetical protein MUK42_28912 [Musa troglodytarum]|uniref:Uncharacterized protein n=1 Tax=Musa troglodytarum TaxID=320322 RepID=A0A9E7K2J7_9LILI|nr:hypothetical protein MUK42_28912 [Musa troglodytarum]